MSDIDDGRGETLYRNAANYSEPLDAKKARLYAEMVEIDARAGDKPLTGGDAQRFENLRRGIEAIDAAERTATREAKIAALEDHRRRYPGSEVSSTSHVQDFHVGRRESLRELYRLDAVDTRDPERAAAEYEARALDVIEKDPHFQTDAHRETATWVVERAGRTGRAAEQIIATASPEYAQAFRKYAFGMADDWTSEERAAMRAADDILRAGGFNEPDNATPYERALAVANVTGKLVPAQLDTSVILTNSGALNPYREIARVVPITTNVWTGINSAGITAEWTGAEGTQVADATPTFSNPAVTAYMWDAFVPMSFQAYEDWYGAQGELERLFTDAQYRLEEAAFATGDGSNKPTGIVTALTNVSHYTQGTNSAFTVADLVGTKQALADRYLHNASWVMNRKYEDRIRQFGTSLGWAYSVDLTAGNVPKVMGSPLYRSTTLDGNCNTSTNYAMVYGDFSEYVIANRVGNVLEFIPNLFSAGNGRPTAQRGWLVHGRVGGSVVGGASAFVLSVNPHS